MTLIEEAVSFYRKSIEGLPYSSDTENFLIRRKVLGSYPELKENGPINIAILGDSVSHGSFAPPAQFDYEEVYHAKLKRMINSRWPTVPVNILNYAVGGECSPFGLKTLKEKGLLLKPDLIIVCFGLNDVNFPLENFSGAMGEIFSLCKKEKTDVMYLTPSMLNTYRSEETAEIYWDYAGKTAEMQNAGMMDSIVEEGRRMANAYGVPVADAYSVWKGMQNAGMDTTRLLVNRINHPDRKMHDLFAELLFARIFGKPFSQMQSETTDS